MIRLCHCELTGMVEILADDIGSCELCISANTREATQENLIQALIFTKKQVEEAWEQSDGG